MTWLDARAVLLLSVMASANGCSSDEEPASTASGGSANSGGSGGTSGTGGAGASAGSGASGGGAGSAGAAGAGGNSGGSGGSSGPDLGCAGDPDIGFESEQDVAAGSISGLSAVDLGDLDGDGRLDAAVFEGGKHASGKVTFGWLEAPSDIGTGSWTFHDFPKPATMRPFIGAAKVGDVDGDKDIDVVLAMDHHSGTAPSAYVYWLDNPGSSGAWTIHTIAADMAVEHINDMELADLDGDGKLDVVVRALSPNQLLMFFQDGKTSWVKKVVDSSPYGATGEGFAVGDIDGKGQLDLSICGHWLQAPSQPRQAAYTAHDIDAGYKSVNANVKEAIGDIDGDGSNDVLLSPAEGYRNGKNHVLAWYEAPDDAAGQWTQHVIEKDFNGGHTARLIDLDGDGDLDVVSGVAWSSWGQTANVTIYRNCGGAFGAGQVLVTGKGLYTGVAADIDADGDVDILGQNAYSGSSKPYLYESLLSGK